MRIPYKARIRRIVGLSTLTWDLPLLACSRLRACFGLLRRVQTNGRVSSDGLLGLGLALAQELVDDDGPKGRSSNTTKREVADVHNKVASAKGQGDRRGDQVATLREVHPVLHPDAPTGSSD